MSRLFRRSAVGGLVLAASLVALLAGAPQPEPHAAALSPAVPLAPGVYVSGNRFVDASGATLQLRGVNHSGSEYACSQGWGIFDGPVGNRSIAAMRTWRIHAIRLPLNEDCWLSINGVDSRYAGTAYRRAIRGYVHRLEAHGLTVILDLHWNAPGRQVASGQQVMADADHSPTFWRSVARAYAADHRVMFELYNEPHDISWSCWLHGCRTSDGWRTAGMQQLLDAVRGAGATNVVIVGGLGWSSDLSRWLAHEPHDPAHQLAAAFHAYNFGGCTTRSCWKTTVGRVARHVPVIATEYGENDCAGGYVTPLMRWFDAHSVSYLAWTWNNWDCRSGPALISRPTGKPTGYGVAVRRHLRARG